MRLKLFFYLERVIGLLFHLVNNEFRYSFLTKKTIFDPGVQNEFDKHEKQFNLNSDILSASQQRNSL